MRFIDGTYWINLRKNRFSRNKIKQRNLYYMNDFSHNRNHDHICMCWKFKAEDVSFILYGCVLYFFSKNMCIIFKILSLIKNKNIIFSLSIQK